MAKASYFIPKTYTTWDLDDPAITDEVSLLDFIKEVEGIKRIPPTWKIFLEKNGRTIEINRRATARMRVEKLQAEKEKVNG